MSTVPGSPDPEGARCGILGGTFDPPHLAHLALAQVAREALHLDRVLFIPAGDPWRKQDREVSPAADRLALVRAAVQGLPWAEVSAIEVERAGPTYTCETVEALAADGNAWWFIMGEDAMHDFPEWRDPERILAVVRLAVARRELSSNGGGPLLTSSLLACLPALEGRVDEVPLPRMAVSATDIRARIRAGQSTGDLLPEAVRQEIEARGLYR